MADLTYRIVHEFEDGSASSGGPDPDFARHLVLAIDDSGNGVGVLPWTPSRDGAHAILIGDLIVDRAHRGHGIATALVKALREHRPDLDIDPGDSMTSDGVGFWSSLPQTLLRGTPVPTPDWPVRHKHVREPEEPEADLSDMDEYEVLTASTSETGVPVGFVRYTAENGFVDIKDLVTYPDFRGRGVATFLMDTLRSRYPSAQLTTEDFSADGQGFRDAYWRLRGNAAFIEAAYE